MRRIITVVSIVLSVAAVAAPAADARSITSGTITVGRGANGISLGMSRATVVKLLGRPIYENANGYMQYASDNSSAMFDIYRAGGAHSTRVRMMGISGAGFKLDDGNYVFAKGGLRRLAKRYGKRLKFRSGLDSGPYYEIVTKLGGHKVLSDFSVGGRSLDSPIGDLFILFA